MNEASLMIVISSSQEISLQRSSTGADLRNIACELGVLYRQTTPADIKRAIHAALEKRDAYGFVSRGAVLCLASLLLDFGPDFDRAPSEPCLRRALFDRNGSEAYRIEELMRHAVKRGRRGGDTPDTANFGTIK